MIKNIKRLIHNIKSPLLTLTAVICLITSTGNAYGGIDLLKKAMPRGTMSNISRGGIIKDQLASHLVGGSVMIKTPAPEELQLANIQAPKCNIGGLPCGAQYDLRGGAISFVEAEAMMEFLREMVANFGAYGAMMAIKTICPHCEDLITWLEAIQRDMSNFLKMDCQNVLAMSQGAFAKITNAGIVNRQSDLVDRKGKSDAAGIAEYSRRESGDPAPHNPNLKDQLGDNFNLVWKALERKTIKGMVAAGGGKGLKELLMSISGTIILEKDGNPAAKFLGSLASKDLIDEYIGTGKGAGKVKLYECDEQTKCLNPQINERTLAAGETLYGHIDKLLSSIITKLKKNNTDFDVDEENLLTLSSMNLLTKIQIDLAMYPDSAEASVRLQEFVEALCYDVVTTLFSRMLNTATEAVSELSYLQLSDTGVFEKFNHSTTDTARLLGEAKSTALKRYDIISSSKARLRQEENYFEMKFEEYMNTNFIEG